jgi:uncharacterized glyoxalase superfamily protein PhnB
MSDPLESPVVPPAETKGGAVVYFNVDGAARAAEFYAKAFGAVEATRHPVDDQGRTMHIHLYINGSSVMLGDFYPEYGFGYEKPQAFTVMLPVADIDAWFKRAVDAGCEVVTEVQTMFWGDRYGQVRDPFGVPWAFNQPQG